MIDERGQALSNERFPSTHESLGVFLAGIKNAKFVLESTGIWEYIHEGIEDVSTEIASLEEKFERLSEQVEVRLSELNQALVESSSALAEAIRKLS